MLACAKWAVLACEKFRQSGKSLGVDINPHEFKMARQRALGNDLRHDKLHHHPYSTAGGDEVAASTSRVQRRFHCRKPPQGRKNRG
jgi:hypothetical protein